MEYAECSLLDLINLKKSKKDPFSDSDILTFLFQITKILTDFKKNNIC